MTAEVYWVSGPWPGRLGIIPRPRGWEWLADEERAWREAGVDVAASLLTPSEVAELGLQDEEAVSQDVGIEFQAFPIPDRGVPDSRKAFSGWLRNLETALDSGKSIVLHCRQGIGRSALVAASLLVAAGEDPDEALRRVERARGVPVPETEAQRRWVADFASQLAAAKAHGE